MRALIASVLVLIAFVSHPVRAQDLALTEVWLGEQPFVEVANVGDVEVDLDGVWLAATPDAASIAAGAGTALALGDGTLAPGELAVVAIDTDAGFGADVRVLGALGDADVSLDPNAGMAWLFAWDGASDLVGDIDVVRWGDDAPALQRDVLEVDGPDDDTVATAYAADTPAGDQASLPPLVRRGIVRLELADPTVGESGNGVDGGDETAEDFATTWGVTGVPTPGAANEAGVFAIAGRVTRDGRAVIGLPVSLVIGGETLTTTTGSAGFRFDGFGADAGVWTLSVGDGDDAAMFEGELVDANEVVDVDLSDAVEVRVDVELVARETPDVSVTATLDLPDGARVIAPAGTPLVFPAVPAGTWTLGVQAPGFESMDARLEVTGATVAAITLYPARPVRLDATVLTARGTPGNGAVVHLVGVGYRAGVSRVATVSEGSVSFPDVPAGYYRLSAELAAESVEVDHIDVLASSSLTVRMASSAVDPPVSKVSNCAAAPGSSAAGMWLLALVALGWRRRC